MHWASCKGVRESSCEGITANTRQCAEDRAMGTRVQRKVLIYEGNEANAPQIITFSLFLRELKHLNTHGDGKI